MLARRLLRVRGAAAAAPAWCRSAPIIVRLASSAAQPGPRPAAADPHPFPPETPPLGGRLRETWVWAQLPTWMRHYILVGMSYVLTHALLSGIIAIAIVLALYWVFRADVISHAAATSSDVLSDTLGNEEVKLQAEILSKAVVERILNDSTTLDLVVLLVVRVLQQPETIAAVKDLLEVLFNDPRMRQLTKAFFLDILSQPEIQSKVNEVGLQTTDDVLHHPQTRQHLTTMFRDVFADRHLQMDVGRALWSATWYSVTPSMLTGPAKPSAPAPERVSVGVGTSDNLSAAS